MMKTSRKRKAGTRRGKSTAKASESAAGGKNKPCGDVPALASSDRGPLSVPIVSPVIQISEPPSNASLPASLSNAGLTSIPSSSSQTTHNPFIWNARMRGWPSYPIVDYHSLSVPTFPCANPSQTFPTVASTLTKNPCENVFTNTAPQNTQSTSGGSQSLATSDPSPRALSESSSSANESDTDDSTPRKSSKRTRISRRNAAHGYVEGAMTGTNEYIVARTRPLRDQQTNASLASRRFKRQVADLVSRAERLSYETECWFILCAQVPGSGLPYHYTSPRFRREALDEASKMVSTFQQATYALNLAKRMEAKKIADTYEQKLIDERTGKKKAEEEVVRGRQREQELQDELEAQKAAVEAYRAQLASRIQAGANAGILPASGD